MNQIDQHVQAIQEKFKGPMDFYNSQRRSDEMDLIATVRKMMEEAGLGERLPYAFDTNRFIMDAVNRPAHAQQYNLNRYLTLQFMAAEDAATMPRYALIYEIAPSDWLTIFRDTVLPALVDANLPVVI